MVPVTMTPTAACDLTACFNSSAAALGSCSNDRSKPQPSAALSAAFGDPSVVRVGDCRGESRVLETIYRHQDIRIDHLQIDTLEIEIGQAAGDVAEIEIFDRERRSGIGDTARRAGTPTERLGDQAPFDQVESASVVERNEARPVPVEFFVHIIVENFLRNLSVSIGIDDHKTSSVSL